MNARDRIARTMAGYDGWEWEGLTESGRLDYLARTDVVLAVLPDLLTDPELVEAAWHAAIGMPSTSGPDAARNVLAGAAKALTEETTA